MNPGQVYYLRAGISLNTYGTVDVSLTTPLLKNASRTNRPPNQIDDFENQLAGYSRLQLGPDGRVQEGTSEANGNVVFWVGEAGLAHFDTSINVAGPGPTEWYVALYRGQDVLASEVNIYKTRLNLIDFANESTKQNGLYSIDAYVEPGLYALAVTRTAGTGAGFAAHTIDLPDVHPERVVIDPNFGDSYSLLRNFDLASEPALSNDRAIVEEYRTTYYLVETPPGSLNGTIAFAYNLSCASPEVNNHALLSVWRQDQDTYERYDSQTNRIDPPEPDPQHDPYCQAGAEDSIHPSLALIQPLVDGEPLRALAFDEFVVAFDRSDLATKVVIESHFEVPQSGTPDLVVESLNMLPNDGETQVVVSVRNVGYAPSPLSKATVFFTGYPAPAQLNEFPLGPFAARVRSMPWTPWEPEDHVMYVTDSDDEIEELFEDNNSIDRQLLEVDAYRPTVEIALGTPSRDGHPGPEWGRYISKVPGVVSDLHFVVTDLDTPADTDLDGIDDHYLSKVFYPNPDFYLGANLLLFGPEPEAVVEDYDLGMLFPTTPENHNQFTLQATDRYGLVSDLVVHTADVKPSLAWLEGEGSSIAFNPQINRYEIQFHNDLIDFPEDPNQRTLSGLLDFDVPFVGDKQNRFLVEIESATTASLDPDELVIAPVTAHALLKILGQTVFDETYGSQQVSNHLQVHSDLVIDSQTLDVTHVKAGAILTDLDLYSWQSPEITLFAFGVPDVASINANLQFGVDVGLNAGVAIALDPNVIQDVLFPPQPLGLTPKSFVQPNVQLSATASGEVEFLGIDLASLSGGVSFTLFVTYGLDTTDEMEVVPFDEFLNHSCFSIDGQLGLLFEADVLGIEVFEVEHFFPQFNIASAGCDHGILTHSGPVGSALAAVAANAQENGIQKQLNGSDPIGSLEIGPRPALALDPKSGVGTYIQVVDVDSDPTLVRGNLAFAHRDKDAWTQLDVTSLLQPEHVANPSLALTHDQAEGQPAVVVYQAAPTPNVNVTTFNQFLTSQDIRSRYFNGTNWLSGDDHRGRRRAV